MATIKSFEDFLDRMQGLLDNANKHGQIMVPVEDLENAFHELVYDEDERIRRELISLFADGIKGINHRYTGEDCERWLAWLEKQGEQKLYVNDNAKEMFVKALERVEEQNNKGYKLTDCDKKSWWEDFKAYTSCTIEQKPADNVEPKFKDGDWVVNKLGDLWHIDSSDKKNYQVSDGKGNYNYFPISKQEEMRLWTIQDAKDGDMLEFGDHGRLVTGILSFVNKTTGKVDVSCLLEGDKFKVGVFYNLDTVKPHPATKEQRDLLFQKMKEAGYEWDAEKKELKKIEPKTAGWIPMDEQRVENLLAIIEEHGYPEEVAWLNSLKDRVQSKQE